MDHENDAPAAPVAARACPASLALVSLTLAALGLAQGAAWLEERTAALRHESIWLAQEAVMQAGEEKLADALFDLDPEKRRRLRLTATAYCPLCGVEDNTPQSAALGGLVRPGRTVAVSQDLKRLLGRKVYIEGFGVRVVEDLMHPRFENRLDLCLPDRRQALAFGVKRLDVVILD